MTTKAIKEKIEETLKPLEGADNWEARLNALFYANMESVDLENKEEVTAFVVVEWLKMYSPLKHHL